MVLVRDANNTIKTWHRKTNILRIEEKKRTLLRFLKLDVNQSEKPNGEFIYLQVLLQMTKCDLKNWIAAKTNSL